MNNVATITPDNQYSTHDIERAILGTMIADNSIIPQVSKVISSDGFSSSEHRAIYKAMLELIECSQPADLIMVSDKVDDNEYVFKEVSSIGYIAELTKLSAPSNWKAYVQLFKEKYAKIKSAEIMELLNRGEISIADASDLLADLDKRSKLHTESIFPDNDMQEDFWFGEVPDLKTVFNECLPLGETGLLTATGGVGKSTLTIQMSLAIALGQPAVMGDAPFLTPTEEGQVVILGGEDTRGDYQRRARDIVAARGYNQDDMRKIASNLRVISLVGEDNRLLEERNGMFKPSPLVDKWIDDIKRKNFPNLRLIVIDPLTRFYGASENDNSLGTLFINTVSKLAVATGAAVLVVHHSSKDNAGSSRGAGSFVDGARTHLSLLTLEQKENKGNKNKEYDKNKRDTLILSMPKSNHIKHWDRDAFFKRSGDSVELRGVAPSQQEEEAHNYYTKQQQARCIYEYVRDNKVSGRQVKADREDVFKGIKPMGERAIENEIKRFKADGHFEQKGNILVVTDKQISF